MPKIEGKDFGDPRLGHALRQLRDKRGLAGDRVASQLLWSPSKVSRIEHGRTMLKPDDLERLLDLYKATPSQRTGIMAIAEASRLSRGAPGVEHAVIAREWAPSVIPALLRTPGYDHAILAAEQQILLTPPSELDQKVDDMQRQQIRLTTDPASLTLHAVIGEGALVTGFGSRDIMAAQLKHLITVADLPDVDIRVMRLGLRDNSGPRHLGPFSHLTFPAIENTQLPEVVLIPGLKTVRLEEEKETWRHAIVFGKLYEAASSNTVSVLKAHHAKWSQDN